MSPFARLLAEAAVAEAPRPHHDAQIARLREAAAFYAAEVPFKVGDLVTPRSDAPLTEAGEPNIVIAVCPDAPHDFASGRAGTFSYGMRPQIRVLAIGDDNIHPYWGEAAMYEPYTGEKAA